MTLPYLDCTNEVSQFQLPPTHRRAWVASEIVDHDWIVNLSESAQTEIAELAYFILQNPVQNLQRRIENYSLPHLRQTLLAMKTILQDGVGFCVLNKLPMDDYPIEVMVEIYWLLGQLIGRPVAQKWNGEMIYDVRDSGVPHHNEIRGSHTNTELVFHTDNAFAKMPPEYVGLLCRYPAKQGGISRFCSLYTVHNRMHQQYPNELKRLYEPMFFNRQAEHHPDAPKISFAPYFSWNNDRLNARANSSLVRAGYDVAEESLDSQLSYALDAIDEICFSEDIWFEGALQRGHLQYLNNKEVGHFRSEFVDHDIPEKKRHLFRLWHRELGSIAYDGYDMT
jgi:hypothetical protein